MAPAAAAAVATAAPAAAAAAAAPMLGLGLPQQQQQRRRRVFRPAAQHGASLADVAGKGGVASVEEAEAVAARQLMGMMVERE